MSYFDLARKDCVGTARNTTSKVWFTVADGVLSDTYWPTVDATNVHTLQYLVTDGTYLHRPPDPGHAIPGDPGPDRDELHRGRVEHRTRLQHHHDLHRRSRRATPS